MIIPEWPIYKGDPSAEPVAPRIEHYTVLADDHTYFGWPANHGAWQWDDTFVFGYAFGTYDEEPMAPYAASMHKVSGPLKKGLMRSDDGGLTWRQDFPCDFTGKDPKPNKNPFNPDHEIYRVCGVYDHGGEDCHPHGAIYTSASRGFVWNGPYSFDGLDEMFREVGVINTSRTCVLGDLIFLSVGHKQQFGCDFVMCAKINLHGFTYLSHIKPEDGSRCVMPSAVRTEDGRIYIACRRRNFQEAQSWVELYRSDDGGLSWKSISVVGETGDPNGNPPALLYKDGRMYCAFGNRSFGVMVLAVSDDFGKSWVHLSLRSEIHAYDFGYPRLFSREDGGVVCVYYWERPDLPPSIEATHVYLP